MMDLPDLSGFSQPTWNGPNSLADAFKRILTAHDADSARSAGSDLRYAVGNDHCGVHRSVVLVALPRMSEILEHPTAGDWSRVAIIDSLNDLWCCFHPEPCFEFHEGQCLKTLVQQQIEALKPLVEAIAKTDGTAAAKAAQELLDDLNGVEHR